MNERKLSKSELAKREDIILNMKANKRDLVKKYGADAEKVMYGRATNMAKKQSESMNQTNVKLKEMVKDALKNPKKADLNKDGKLSDYEEKRGAAIEKSMVDEIDLDLKGGTQSNTDDAEAGILGAEDVLGLEEGSSSEEKRIAMSAIKRLAKYRGVSDSEARQDLIRAAKEVGDLKENFNQVDSQFEDLSQVVKNIANVGEMSIEDAAMGAIDHIGEKFNVDLDFGRMNEDLDLGHEDNEPGMLKSDLYRIGKYAMDLYQMMDEFEAGSEEVDFPHWWQAKIIRAKDSLVGAKHYLDFEVKEPAIDALVNNMDDIAPEMEIDVVDGIEEVDNFNPKKTDDPQLDSFRAKGQLEGNLDPKETASLEQEGRFWVVTYRTMDGKESKPFQSEDEARKFYNTLDEGLPKGYWDKKMDAKDEVKETLDDSAFDMADSIYDAIGGIEFKKAIVKAMSTDDAKLYLSAIMRDYALDEASTDYAKRRKKEKDSDYPEAYKKDPNYSPSKDKKDVDESYNTLVNKIKKQGKSEKAAKAIAGAVASYKAKGGGKGPTAKQKG